VFQGAGHLVEEWRQGGTLAEAFCVFGGEVEWEGAHEAYVKKIERPFY
jgi:hypothetical protein